MNLGEHKAIEFTQMDLPPLKGIKIAAGRKHTQARIRKKVCSFSVVSTSIIEIEAARLLFLHRPHSPPQSPLNSRFATSDCLLS